MNIETQATSFTNQLNFPSYLDEIVAVGGMTMETAALTVAGYVILAFMIIALGIIIKLPAFRSALSMISWILAAISFFLPILGPLLAIAFVLIGVLLLALTRSSLKRRRMKMKLKGMIV